MTDDTASGPSAASKFAIPNAVPRSLFSGLSAHKSDSGLFTPLTEQDSSPAGFIHTSEGGLGAVFGRSRQKLARGLLTGKLEGVPAIWSF